MKIAFFELEGWEEPILRKALPEHELVLRRDALTLKNVQEVRDAEIISVFIRSRVTSDLLDALPSLKAIITRSAGFDHVDVEACKSRKVALFNIPNYGSQTIAEYTFMLILMLARKAKELKQTVEKNSLEPASLRGIELSGKTIGIVGTGRIGSRVAQIARAFGMKVLAFDLIENEELKRTGEVQYVDLDTLLSSSDVISLHVPLTPQTRHLINRSNVEKIKRGALLVNTARGEVVEIEALIEALEKGILAGVALDVFEGEWVFDNSWSKTFGDRGLGCERYAKAVLALKLSKYPNVILTPHLAYNTWEAVERIITATIDTIRGFIEGRQLSNAIVKP
ncbi:MAG: NAD(P)-binding domain-containing protein [Thermofilaceae archaeon]|nr:NAD(P)-binding domain-containing protein [Thermofilaceae archaeon]MCX8181337.1 NAD(P)-binding domain-containing protein [Thermofilaceae archaeon]MDW8003580.1 NAD(P)-dependent oxidoreductase [Thermofilaceae archaeon]